MGERSDVTRMLSKLVEKRLTNRCMLWSREVTFDMDTDRERRVDYVGFTPYRRPNGRAEAEGLELGTFEFYEIKSCLADFTSGHGLTFYGDENWLVTTRELAERLRTGRMLDGSFHVLAPTSDGARLHPMFGYFDDPGRRRTRPAGEILIRMLDAPRPIIKHGERAATSREEP